MSFDTLESYQQAYADLILRAGVNLQPGQSLLIRCELAQRDFANLLTARAYDAGARFVDVRWHDPLNRRTRYQHIDPSHLEYLPAYHVAALQEMLDDGWCQIGLHGSEYPDAYEDIDPALMLKERLAWGARMRFFSERVMNNEITWCVASAPTAAWALKVFPDLDANAATERLWRFVLQACRADQPDPLEAWREHDANLKQVVAFMDRNQVRTIRYLDKTPGPDGKPATDLTVGLTDRPTWSAGSSVDSKGRVFFANIPTEEIFSTPHKDRTQGWVRTSKPGYPFDREVTSAYFRFEEGNLVEWRAERGQEVLDQLFEIPGSRQLGELSLVDVRSPINQAGLLFYDTLFDENAVCHVAFGRGYPEGVKDGNSLSQQELDELGVNRSDTHVDLMIGTDTMKVLGFCEDGRQVVIMEDGQFTDEVLGTAVAGTGSS